MSDEFDPTAIPSNDPDFSPNVTPDPSIEATPEGVAGIPQDTYITIRTSSGGSAYVPATEAMTVRDLIVASNLAIQGRYDVYLDQVVVPQDAFVPVGATVTLLGNVKGA
jgi:hypothetical protein